MTYCHGSQEDRMPILMGPSFLIIYFQLSAYGMTTSLSGQISTLAYHCWKDAHRLSLRHGFTNFWVFLNLIKIVTDLGSEGTQHICLVTLVKSDTNGEHEYQEGGRYHWRRLWKLTTAALLWNFQFRRLPVLFFFCKWAFHETICVGVRKTTMGYCKLLELWKTESWRTGHEKSQVGSIQPVIFQNQLDGGSICL